MFRKAYPWASSAAATSPQRIPAETVAVDAPASTSTRGGSPASDTRTGASATRLNECRVPSARIRGLPATSSCSSSTEAGSATEGAV